MSAVPIIAASGSLPSFCRQSTETELAAVGCVVLHWGMAILILLAIAAVGYVGYRLFKWLRLFLEIK